MTFEASALLDSAKGQGAPDGSEPDVRSIAEAHPPAEPRKRKKYRVRDANGNLVDRESLGSSPGQAEAGNQQSGLASGVALSPIAREQVVSCVKSLFTIIDSRCTKLIERSAVKITGDKAFALDLAQETAMTDVEKDTITSLSVIVLEKYNVLGTYAPECLLGIALVGYGYRVHSALSDLKKHAATHGLPAQTVTAPDHGQIRDGKV
jgi:hypothetical protein